MLPKPGAFSDTDKTILAAADAMIGTAREHMKTQQLHQVLNAVWAVVADANRYFAARRRGRSPRPIRRGRARCSTSPPRCSGRSASWRSRSCRHRPRSCSICSACRRPSGSSPRLAAERRISAGRDAAAAGAGVSRATSSRKPRRR